MGDELRLNEPVEVAVIFKSGQQPCQPLRFRRASGRVVEVTEIGLGYPKSSGRKTLHIFDVTDGGADYRLEFDSERLTWRLTFEGDHYE